MTGLSLPVVVLALALLTAWGMAVLVLPLFARLADRVPGVARWSFAVAAVPWVVGAVVAIAGVLPGDPHLDAALGCHCATSMPGWLHLCPAHPGHAAGLVPAASVVLLLLLPGRLGAVATLVRQPRGHGGGATPTITDLPSPTALLHGWLRPGLVVDRTLWSALSEPHRAAVLAHERAHLARRDPLALAVLQLLLSIAPAPIRHRVVRAWLGHAEARADAIAAETLGDPGMVAEALVRCARLAAPPPLALAWNGGHLERRVQALLRPGSHAPAIRRPDAGLTDALLLAGVTAALLSATPWLHHQLEHLLNLSL